MEDTQVYTCDPIRDQRIDLAVLDCAYGLDETPYYAACGHLVRVTERLLSMHGLLLFPVPKYGRGLEILKLFSDHLRSAAYSADDVFLKNLTMQRAGGFWYKPNQIDTPVQPYSGQRRGIVFVSDPQLRTDAARAIADQVLANGGVAVMTGTLEKGSYSEYLFSQGKMALLRYPVHQNHAQFERLNQRNKFRRSIPYHSPELHDEMNIRF